jgi:hypothetical protein
MNDLPNRLGIPKSDTDVAISLCLAAAGKVLCSAEWRARNGGRKTGFTTGWGTRVGVSVGASAPLRSAYCGQSLLYPSESTWPADSVLVEQGQKPLDGALASFEKLSGLQGLLA